MLTKENLKEHWWFRLLKVIHISALCFGALVVVLIAYSERPILDRYTSTYQFRCNNEHVLRGTINGSSVYFDDKGNFLLEDMQDFLRFFCENPAESESQYNKNPADYKERAYLAQITGKIPSENNFEILMKDPAYSNGSWDSVTKIILFGIFSIVVVDWIVRSIFMYVLIGEVPKIPPPKE